MCIERIGPSMAKESLTLVPASQSYEWLIGEFDNGDTWYESGMENKKGVR